MSDYRHISAALDFLNLQGDLLVTQVVERQCAATPRASWSMNPKMRLRCVEDNRFHLHYLAASIQAGNPEIFSDYCGWVKVLLGKRGIAAFHLKENLEHWKAALLASSIESAADVIILRGIAEERIPDRALAERLSEESKKKYGYSPGTDEYMKTGLWVLRARTALGWKQFPKDVTLWAAES